METRLDLEKGPGARRLARWHPYPTAHSPAASSASGESSSSSPSCSKRPLVARGAISSAFRAPRTAAASRSAPLEFMPVVRAQHGLAAPRSDSDSVRLAPEAKLQSARCLVEQAMNILASAWKTVENNPFPVTDRTSFFTNDTAVAAPHSATSSHGMPPPQTKISAHDGSQYPYQSTAEHMPLKQFIHEVLRRSRTNFITLQTALCYVEAIAAKLPTLVKEEAEYMLLRALPDYDEEATSVPALPSPLLCPRRTFLASILLASKFLQDRSYSNKAWAKLTGLAAREVGRCERALFAALHYRLWVGKGSEPTQVIEGLDMVPVVAIDAVFQPDTEKTQPLLLRKAASEASLGASFSSTSASGTAASRTAKPARAWRSIVLSAPVEGPAVAGPSNWEDVSLPQPPSPTGTDLQSLTASQPDAYPDYASSSSFSPDSLCYTQSSSGSSSYSEVGTPPDDMVAGLHGPYASSSAVPLHGSIMGNGKLAVHSHDFLELSSSSSSDIVGGSSWS